jgi:ketosteroid isomerase-like protein
LLHLAVGAAQATTALPGGVTDPAKSQLDFFPWRAFNEWSLAKLFANHKNKGTSMKNASVWCLLGLLALASTAVSQAAQTSRSTEKAVAALEEKWLESQKTNNPDLVAPLLADKFVSTGSDGKVTDKSEALAHAKARKYASAEYEDVKITVFGNTAIATGGFKAKGTGASGKSFDEHERWTDTWVKMPDGKWQCVATHGSPIKA